ncbi:MAG: T9SS type A sorting domain-containing protein [Saprospiraceae bacterium]
MITLSNVASNLHGIKIEGGDQNTFDVNHVAGVGGKSDGILATHPSRSNFWCNGAYRTKNGLHFEGMLSGRRAADVAGNSMTENETGMLLGASAVIGKQEHRGNIWGGGFTSIGANCLGDPTNSPFIVDVAENPQFMPPTFSPANWFLDNNNTNSSYLCASLVNPNGPGTGLDEDLSIVHGTIGGEQHTALNNWIARNRLYERLTEEGNPHTGNQEIAAFLNGAQSNGIAAFSAVRAGIRQAFVISQADQTALVEAEDQLQEGFSALGQVEAALTATGLAHQDSLDLVDARSEIQGSIELVSGQKVTILHNHLLQRLPTINALITQNNNLIAFDPWEQHEKTVNDIFLHTIGLGSFEFTATQLNALGGIAGLCPLSDGEAVLRARALLAITDEVPTVYDDAIICQPAEERNYAQTGEAQPIMRVYPNPASDAVTIDYRRSKYSEHRLLLYNVFGKVVFETSLSEQQGRLTLPLQVLPPGIYWCQIPTAGSQKTISKLVISR